MGTGPFSFLYLIDALEAFHIGLTALLLHNSLFHAIS